MYYVVLQVTRNNCIVKVNVWYSESINAHHRKINKLCLLIYKPGYQLYSEWSEKNEQVS